MMSSVSLCRVEREGRGQGRRVGRDVPARVGRQAFPLNPLVQPTGHLTHDHWHRRPQRVDVRVVPVVGV
jgi:hypothetical protein